MWILSSKPGSQWLDLTQKRHHIPWYDGKVFWKGLDSLSGREKGKLIDYREIATIVKFILTANPNDSDIEFKTKTKKHLNKIRNIALSGRIKEIKALMILCHKDRETWYADIQQPAEAMRTEKEAHIGLLERVISLLEERDTWEANSNKEIEKLRNKISILRTEIKELEKFIITDEEQKTIQGHEIREKKVLEEFINAMMPLAREYAKANKIQLPRYLTPGIIPSIIRRTKTIANTSAEIQLTLWGGIAIVSQLAQTITQEVMYRMANAWEKASKYGAHAIEERPRYVKLFESKKDAEELEGTKEGLDNLHEVFGNSPEIIGGIMNAASVLSIAWLLYTIGSLVPQADMGNFSEKALDNKKLQRMVGLTITATVLAMAFGDPMGYFLVNSVEQLLWWWNAWPAPYNPNPGH